MNNKNVIEYFDTYFSNFDGELNESTSNEQLEEAALDLINLTEDVLLFVEKLLPAINRARILAKKSAASQVASKHLKKPFLNLPLTPNQRLRHRNRQMAMKTEKGRELLRHLDTGGAKKDKQAAKAAIRKAPEAAAPQRELVATDVATKKPIYKEKPSVVQQAMKSGERTGKSGMEKLGSQARDVHRELKGDAPLPRGIKGVKSQDPSKKSRLADLKAKVTGKGVGKAAKTAAKVAGIGALGALGLGAGGLGIAAMQKESVNNGEKEEQTPSMPVGELEHVRNLKLRKQRLDTMRKERDIKDKRTDAAAAASAGESPHKQKSLVIHDPEKGGWTPITDKGAKEVERETKSAAEKSSSIMDIIKKNPQLKHREKMGGTRKEREARGQGRLDFDPPTKPDEPTKKVPSHLKLGDGKGSPSDRFRTSIPLNRSSTDRRTRTRKGSEATK